MSEEPNQAGEEQPRKRLSPVAVVLALLVLYPLSIGPMVKVVGWMGLDLGATFTIFYALYFPILWVSERVPWFGSLLKWYLSFFNGQS